MQLPTIAIVCTVRDPDPFFKTWIDYHSRLVDRLYIYLDYSDSIDDAIVPLAPAVRYFNGDRKSSMSGPNGVMQRQVANVEHALDQCRIDEID